MDVKLGNSLPPDDELGEQLHHEDSRPGHLAVELCHSRPSDHHMAIELWHRRAHDHNMGNILGDQEQRPAGVVVIVDNEDTTHDHLGLDVRGSGSHISDVGYLLHY